MEQGFRLWCTVEFGGLGQLTFKIKNVNLVLNAKGYVDGLPEKEDDQWLGLDHLYLICCCNRTI